MRGVTCSPSTWPGRWVNAQRASGPLRRDTGPKHTEGAGMPDRKRNDDVPQQQGHPSVAPLHIVGDPEDLDTDRAILATMHEILVVMRQGVEELRAHGDRLAAIEGTMRRNTEVTEKYIAKRLGWKGEKRDRP